ncbi:tyrosine-type recombinase/integrase [Burkholderia gladioli]|uniref:tyrosine-type recombinase/integrase n=1 Tax=Burkholderia gladioli TaxID=28095 RepID=UPI00163F8F26|nr:site-specific integrase [Burkholderia gladioli]
MANSRQIHRLNALRVSREVKPGYHADGGGLYLQISQSGSRSWIFRFTLAKRAREMGIGPLSTTSLAEARALAAEYRKMLADGIDPIEARNEQRALARAEHSEIRTFMTAATEYIEAHRGSWKNAKHGQQWTNTLATYAYPKIGAMDVREVDTPAIVEILRKMWTSLPETASRVRGRIESILDAEKALGHRAGENPARWRGHLEQILPKRNRARRVQHHPALPWADLPDFMRELRARDGLSARMLELLILTAVRTQEVIAAREAEFSFDRGVWIVPSDRMKMELPLRVPLSTPAADVARAAIRGARYGYLFPGQVPGKPLSNMAMLNLLERMGYGNITVHGFRSTFRDWVAECTEYPDSLAEMALAHTVENKVEGAYRRGDMLERRRELMEDWAAYCCSGAQPDNVIQLPMRSAG